MPDQASLSPRLAGSRPAVGDSCAEDAARPGPGYRHAYRPWTRGQLPTPQSSLDTHDGRHVAPTYRRDQYFAVQQPLSSERHEIRTPPPPSSGRHEHDGPAPRHSLDSDTSTNGWRPPQADGDVLMQEGGAQGFGSLAHEGAGEEHSRESVSAAAAHGEMSDAQAMCSSTARATSVPGSPRAS